jgi:hypothetical protein
MRTRLTLAAILLLMSWPGAAQMIKLADGGASDPRLAVGSNDIAVVWRQDNLSIYAAILDSFGNLVKAPFAIAQELDGASEPRVAAAGNIFLAVWWSQPFYRSGKLRAAVLDRSGVRQPAFTIASPTHGGGSVVASDGTQYLVFWPDSLTERAAWVNTAGVVGEPFDVVTGASINDAVASNGTAVAVWSRVAPNAVGLTNIVGRTASEPHTIASLSQPIAVGAASIAANATGYYLAWESPRSVTEVKIEGTRLTADAAPLDLVAASPDQEAHGTTIDSGTYGIRLNAPLLVSAARDGFFVGWMAQGWIGFNSPSDELRGRYIEADGTPSTAIRFAVPIPTPPAWDRVASGMTIALANGTPIATYASSSGQLFVRYNSGGPRLRAARH